MKKILFVMVCLMATCLGASAQKDTKYEAELDKVVGLALSKESVLETFENSFNTSLVQTGTMTADKCHGMTVEVVDLMYPVLVEETKDMYRETFDYDELKKVYEWYSSPIGKKVINLNAKSGEIAQRMMQNPEYLQKIAVIISKYAQIPGNN